MPKARPITALRGADARKMQASLPSILNAEHDFFAADHRAFGQAAAWRRRAAKIRSTHLSLTPRELAQPVSGDRKELLKELARHPKQPMASRKGHNPARYAPFDFTDSQILPASSPPGVSPFTFGPDAATGRSAPRSVSASQTRRR